MKEKQNKSKKVVLYEGSRCEANSWNYFHKLKPFVDTNNKNEKINRRNTT